MTAARALTAQFVRTDSGPNTYQVLDAPVADPTARSTARAYARVRVLTVGRPSNRRPGEIMYLNLRNLVPVEGA